MSSNYFDIPSTTAQNITGSSEVMFLLFIKTSVFKISYIQFVMDCFQQLDFMQQDALADETCVSFNRFSGDDSGKKK